MLNVLFFDCYLTPYAAYVDVNSSPYYINCILDDEVWNGVSTAYDINNVGGTITVLDCIIYGRSNMWSWLNNTTGATLLGKNNTLVGFDDSVEGWGLMFNDASAFISINELILHENKERNIYGIGDSGASIISKYLCAYSKTGKLDEHIHYQTDALGQAAIDFDGLLEVDPLLRPCAKP